MTEDLEAAVGRIARYLPPAQVRILADAVARYEGPTPSARSKAVGAVAVPRFADEVGRLIRAWQGVEGISGAGLAVALRAASQAVDSERESESIEIVWTGPTTGEVPVRLTREALIDVIRSARKSLIVVSFAAYKVPAVVSELEAAADRGARVRLILEQPAETGGTLQVAAAPAFQAIRDRVSVYVWPETKRPKLEKGRAALHAKATVADDHTAFVTSANLTGHAIEENMELGLLVRGGPIPRRLAAHFQQLMADQVLEEVLQ